MYDPLMYTCECDAWMAPPLPAPSMLVPYARLSSNVELAMTKLDEIQLNAPPWNAWPPMNVHPACRGVFQVITLAALKRSSEDRTDA